jgi:hypothetical protein
VFTAATLVSYHGMREQGFDSWWHLQGAYPGIPVVLDSGAFSAANTGVPIGVLEYGRFVKQYGARFSWCANLDVIGDAAASYRQWQALRDMTGREIVPVLHLGAAYDWLDRYAAQGARRIAFGGLVPHMARLAHATPGCPIAGWLNGAWDAARAARMTVHGFGVASPRIIASHPWESCDSSSAHHYARRRQNWILGADGRRVRLDSDTGGLSASELSMMDRFEVRYVDNGFGRYGEARGRRLLSVASAMLQAVAQTGAPQGFVMLFALPNGAERYILFEAAKAWNDRI